MNEKISEQHIRELMSEIEDLIEETYDDEAGAPRNDIAEYYRGKRVGYRDILNLLEKLMKSKLEV